MKVKPMLLCILDGWGYRKENQNNAIANANTPNWDKLLNEYPNSFLETSGNAVGLPQGQMGNSEVGHMNIGSGRVIMQNLPRIDKAFASNFESEHIDNLVKNIKGKCHIMGLMSEGGVHSHQDHIVKLAKLLQSKNIEVVIHAFLDGRDTSPKSAMEYINKFNSHGLKINTIAGRFYAMDRDNRWDRIKKAYDVIIDGKGNKFDNIEQAINSSYESEIYDEFIEPSIIGNYEGANDGDAFVMVNFRADRVRQILAALVDPEFDSFDRRIVNFSSKVGMVEYSDKLNKYLDVLFPAIEIQNSLGEVFADNGLKQLRIAETEKYAHVTFFFNGGVEDKFENEERILINSPDVKTYDLKPEMSAHELTDELVKQINKNEFSLIVVNYANTDMVGHTGDMDATIKAVEAVDHSLGRLVEAVKNINGNMLITADHGNAEMMKDENGNIFTSHTTGPVPLVFLGDKKIKNGSLCDIAPTILDILNIDIPADMTGKSLIGD